MDILSKYTFAVYTGETAQIRNRLFVDKNTLGIGSLNLFLVPASIFFLSDNSYHTFVFCPLENNKKIFLFLLELEILI